MLDKDFTPTKETVSLHGLGFIQLVLPANRRLHVWHPELPRRDCYEKSAIHNHRFSFISRVLKGTQINVPVDVELALNGTHQIISHNGPRSRFGGRESYVVAECNICKNFGKRIPAGEQYTMRAGDYHYTPVDGIVVTLMEKTEETTVHAHSIITKGARFHQEFDRFQLDTDTLMDYVKIALLA